jgi:hypothetical protein
LSWTWGCCRTCAPDDTEGGGERSLLVDLGVGIVAVVEERGRRGVGS